MPSCRYIAGDALILESLSKDSRIVLIKRKHEPFKDMLAIPGGLMEEDETIEQCVRREAKEETGLDVKIIKLLTVKTSPKRDPRKVISISFVCLGNIEDARAGDDAKEIVILPLKEALKQKLAADHNEILEDLWRFLEEL